MTTATEFAQHLIMKTGSAIEGLALTTSVLINRLSKEYHSTYEWEYDLTDGDEMIVKHVNVWKRKDTRHTEKPFKMVLDDKWNELVTLLIKENRKTNPDIDPTQPQEKPFVPLPDWAVE